MDTNTLVAVIEMIENKLMNNASIILEKHHSGQEITEAQSCMDIGAKKELISLRDHLQAHVEYLVNQAENNLSNNQ